MKDHIKFFFFLISFFSFSFQIEAQESELFFEHISNDESFSQSLISSIAQTKKGFIWIGTDNGLVKYVRSGFRMYEVPF